MKLESLLLRGLFFACLTVCGLVIGAMLVKGPDAVRLAARAGAAPVMGAALIVPASQCALPPDGVVCPRQAG
ncbi:MAG: hypothetical protein KGN77_00610 [Xanthomonadaceae bacterium]|nr:hypothetical protein [Xanthomonadaceae bacterium]MDE1964500.1 hypothetical protein [Xanthomonadaceae bacterium]